jgi:hypothetical protein
MSWFLELVDLMEIGLLDVFGACRADSFDLKIG